MLRAFRAGLSPVGETLVTLTRDGVALMTVTPDQAELLIEDRTVDESVRSKLVELFR